MQTGLIMNVQRQADILLSTGETVRDISTTLLQPFLRFAPDQHVLHTDGRFGRIRGVRRLTCSGAQHS